MSVNWLLSPPMSWWRLHPEHSLAHLQLRLPIQWKSWRYECNGSWTPLEDSDFWYFPQVRLQMNKRSPRGPIRELQKIASEEGVMALWKGVGPAMIRAAALTASQLATYDESKQVSLGCPNNLLSKFDVVSHCTFYHSTFTKCRRWRNALLSRKDFICISCNVTYLGHSFVLFIPFHTLYFDWCSSRQSCPNLGSSCISMNSKRNSSPLC